MKKQYRLLIIILTLFLGVIFAPRISVNAESTIEITNINSLNYINEGTVEFEYVGFDNNNDYEIFNVYFNDGINRYLKRNLNIPPVVSDESLENATYRVENDIDGIKRVYLNFKTFDGFEVEWELTSGKYIANEVVITESKIVKIDDGTYHYIVMFSTDLVLDMVYRVDVEYTKYKKSLFIKYDIEDVKETIQRHDVNQDNVFYNFTSKIFGNYEPFYNIRIPDNEYYEFYGDYDFIFDLEPGGYVEEFSIVKLFYITNGEFFVSDIDMDPINPDKDIDSLMFEWKQFKNGLADMISWFGNNSNTILIIVVGFFLTTILTGILPSVLLIFNSIFRSIMFLIKLVILIIKLPFIIVLALFSKGKKQKYKYNFKY